MQPQDKKILVVEDEGLIRRALVDQLEAEEFQVLAATNGQEGLEMAVKEKPDLILLDVIMPIMDGIMTSEKLEEHAETKDIPVVFLTNLSDSKDVKDKITREKYDYLVKANWDITDVLDKVKAKLAGFAG